jgi:hypothetical protein
MRLNRNAEADRCPILYTPVRSQEQEQVIAIAADAFAAWGDRKPQMALQNGKVMI